MIKGIARSRLWGLILSISVQQLIFAILAWFEIMQLYVSSWVPRAPVFILWIMYVAAPLIYLRPLTTGGLIRSYAVPGWFFVAGATAWIVTYWVLCDKFGVPVSWHLVKDKVLYR